MRTEPIKKYTSDNLKVIASKYHGWALKARANGIKSVQTAEWDMLADLAEEVVSLRAQIPGKKEAGVSRSESRL